MRSHKTDQSDQPPACREGASVGLLIICLFYLVLGFILGAWLW